MASRKPDRNSNTKDQRMRQQLAQEAARIIAEEGIKDFHVAKQKAALRLHAPHTHNLPRNDEIQIALGEYQRLFKADSQPHHLYQLRKTSSQVMALFQRFEPRLVGAVADGSADEYSNIDIHLFTDSSEEITLFLIEEKIAYELGHQNLAMANDKTIELPVYHVSLDNVAIELTVFNLKRLRQAPRNPATGKPMERLNIKNLDELLRLSAN